MSHLKDTKHASRQVITSRKINQPGCWLNREWPVYTCKIFAIVSIPTMSGICNFVHVNFLDGCSFAVTICSFDFIRIKRSFDWIIFCYEPVSLLLCAFSCADPMEQLEGMRLKSFCNSGCSAFGPLSIMMSCNFLFFFHLSSERITPQKCKCADVLFLLCVCVCAWLVYFLFFSFFSLFFFHDISNCCLLI